jgi:hypothetical protein
VVRPFATGAYYDLDISFYSAGSGTTGGTLQDCYRVTRLVSAGAATTTSYAPGCPALTATSDYSLFTNELAPAFAPSPLQKWKYFDAGKKSLSVKTWPTLPYDDSAWAVGASPLGYGAGNVTWGTTLASNAGFTGKGRAFYYFRTVLCIASDTISQVGVGRRRGVGWVVGGCKGWMGWAGLGRLKGVYRIAEWALQLCGLSRAKAGGTADGDACRRSPRPALQTPPTHAPREPRHTHTQPT